MTNPFPIPRTTRQTDILLGNGGANYGPFAFKVFDVEDIEIWIRPEGGSNFRKLDDLEKQVDKVSDLPFDFFTVSLASPITTSTEYVVRSARLAERSAGVQAGTRLEMAALEKELSKVTSVLQEQARDIGRSVKPDFGVPTLTIDGDIADGRMLVKVGDRLAAGPLSSATEINEAALRSYLTRSEAAAKFYLPHEDAVYIISQGAFFRRTADDVYDDMHDVFRFQSLDGAKFVLRSAEITPEMATAAGDFDVISLTGANDVAPIIWAADYADYFDVPLVISSKHAIQWQPLGIRDGVDRDIAGNRSSLFFKDYTKLRIIGRGGELWFYSGPNRDTYACMIHAETCRYLSITGELTMTWIRMPYLQGRVAAINAGYVDVTVDGPYWRPSFADVQRVNKWDNTKRTQVLTVRDRPTGSFDAGSAISQVAGDTYRIIRGVGEVWDVAHLSVGDLVTADHQIYGFGAISGYRVDEIYIGTGVKINHCAGIAIWLRSGRKAVIEKGVEISPYNSSDRLLSSSADGIWVGGYKEVYIDGNRIRRTGDDTINVNGYNTLVNARLGANSLSLKSIFPFIVPEAGDRILLRNLATTDTQLVHLTGVTPPPIPSAADGGGGLVSYVVTTSETIAPGVNGNWIAIFIETGRVTAIEGNDVGFNRGRGILASTRNVSIRNNKISETGIAAYVGTYGTEYGYPELVSLESNDAFNVNLNPYYPAAKAAFIIEGRELGAGGNGRTIGKAVITKNSVTNSNGAVAQIEGVVDAQVSLNTSNQVALAPHIDPPALGSGPFAYSFVNCEFFVIADNNNSGSLLNVGVSNVDSGFAGQNAGIRNPQGSADVSGWMEVLERRSVVSAVNRLRISNAVSGASPLLEAAGADASIAARIAAKGNQSVTFESNGVVVADAYGIASSAAFVRLQGQIAGYPVSVSAQSFSQANVGLDLVSKGAAPVRSSAPFGKPSYTVATVPSASVFAGCEIYVSNGASNKRMAVSDGSNWRFPDGAIIS